MEQQNQQSTKENMERKPSIKTNWKLIGIVAVLGLIIGGGAWWLSTKIENSVVLIPPIGIP